MQRPEVSIPAVRVAEQLSSSSSAHSIDVETVGPSIHRSPHCRCLSCFVPERREKKSDVARSRRSSALEGRKRSIKVEGEERVTGDVREERRERWG